ATPGGECDGCVVDGDCGANDECYAYTCDQGLCSVEVDAACCDEGSSYPVTGGGALSAEDFEGNAFFTEWSLEDDYDDNVTWQLSEARPYSGTTALYMGDPATMTYEANPPNPAKATAWTPIFTVDETPGETVLSFQVFMSTEYDGTNEPCPGDTWDVLSVWVLPVGVEDAQMVWASNSAFCNTTNGEYAMVGVDLGDYAGEIISLGFMFDSGDAAGSGTANDYEGVYIDDVSVSSWCADECLSDGDCGGADACTSVWCDLGACASDTTAGCCTVDGDCAGDNACATGICTDNTCDYTYSSDMGCCSETWLGVELEDFESGLGGYTTMGDSAPVVWHLTEVDSWSGTTSVTFSDPATGTYDGGGAITSGELWSPAIEVPPFTAGTPYVEFQMLLETEWDVNDPEDFFPDWPIDELCVGLVSVSQAASFQSCTQAVVFHGLVPQLRVEIMQRGEALRIDVTLITAAPFEDNCIGLGLVELSCNTG
ncbi:MAG: hypothetical protein QF464_16190, partial [Myxococcota bacterium]|nr:hypothetical protein [Myxococcota bacterium]